MYKSPIIYASQPLDERVMIYPHFTDEKIKAQAGDWQGWNVVPVWLTWAGLLATVLDGS